MHKVFLFGSRDLYGIPDVISQHIMAIIQQTGGDVEFIVGDANGVDAGFHQVLSATGGRRMTKIYCMGKPRSNKFDLPVKSFDIHYDETTKIITMTDEDGMVLDEAYKVEKVEDFVVSRNYYEMKDKQMCKDCTFAICFWDGKSKGTLRNIDRLKAQGKYVYVYTAQV